MRNSKKSQLVTAFATLEKYIGIVTNFLILRSFQITLKLHKNHNLNHFAPTHTLLRRLCPWLPDPNTVGKLRLSSFCIYKNIGGLPWADFELKLMNYVIVCCGCNFHYTENSPMKRYSSNCIAKRCISLCQACVRQSRYGCWLSGSSQCWPSNVCAALGSGSTMRSMENKGASVYWWWAFGLTAEAAW